ncbi:DEAD/DEAH box helicase [Saprospira grandis]|uniref:DNA 3'-5' helicase n=1 Tax=Saprospira grandis (strain Lewin) TaxID=984262 RepID=H6L300_SAPGL|nr:DEAD/DEAH box helicase [Saprospira grandis]AFC23727.1 ATP-dependent DNA helicase, RecQ family protein [Saprospira grandis str. Lewin]
MKALIKLFNQYNIDYKALINNLESIGEKLENFIGIDWLVSAEVLSLFSELEKGHSIDEAALWRLRLKKYKVESETILTQLEGRSFADELGKVERILSREETRSKNIGDSNSLLTQLENITKLEHQILGKKLKLGVVNFIAEDKSHGYVLLFKNFNELKERKFMKNKRGPYLRECSNLKRTEIIEFEHQNNDVIRPQSKLNAFVFFRKGIGYAHILHQDYYQQGIEFPAPVRFKFKADLYRVKLSFKYKGGVKVDLVEELNNIAHESFLLEKLDFFISKLDVVSVLYAYRGGVDEGKLKKLIKSTIQIVDSTDDQEVESYIRLLDEFDLSLNDISVVLNSFSRLYLKLLSKGYKFGISTLDLIQKDLMSFEKYCAESTPKDLAILGVELKSEGLSNEIQQILFEGILKPKLLVDDELQNILTSFAREYPHFKIDLQQLHNGTSLNVKFSLFCNGVLNNIEDSDLEEILRKGYNFEEVLNSFYILEQSQVEKLLRKVLEHQIDFFFHGIDVNNKDLANRFKVILDKYPSIVVSTKHFKVKSFRFYIDLYEKGILKELLEEDIKDYIENEDDLSRLFENINNRVKLGPRILEALLIAKLRVKNTKDVTILFNELPSLRKKFLNIDFQKVQFNVDDKSLLIDLYEANVVRNISTKIIQEVVKEQRLEEDGVYDYVNSLSISAKQKLSVFGQFRKLKKRLISEIKNAIEIEFKKLNFLSLDIESNGEEIYELSFIDVLGVHTFKGGKVKEGIIELKERLLKAEIIIGHNIKQFDLPILKKHGIELANQWIWDTLESEFVINPLRPSFALKTSHQAEDDAKLCLELFKSQYARSILSKDKGLKDLLFPLGKKPLELVDIDVVDWEENANVCFRSCSRIAFFENYDLENFLIPGERNFVFCPPILYDELASFCQVYFLDSRYSYILNENKLSKLENSLDVAILKRFIEKRLAEGRLAYWETIPLAIRIRIGNEKKAILCDLVNYQFLSSLEDKNINVVANNIDSRLRDILIEEKVRVVKVGYKISLLTNRHSTNYEYEITDLYERLKGDKLLLKMTGGRNFIAIDSTITPKLGIANPETVKTIWLENDAKGVYKVFYSIDYEKVFLEIGKTNEIIELEANFSSKVDRKVCILRADIEKSNYTAEQYRVNPESLQRALYWTYQFKLISGVSSNRLKVLLINDVSEQARIEGLAQSYGYYVPNENLALGRKLELLSSANNGLLVCPIGRIEEVLSFIEVAVDFYWDSFLLKEKEVVIGEQLSLLSSDLKGQNEEKINPISDNIQKKGVATQQGDIFALLKVHKFLVDYYYHLIYKHNPESSLHLADVRLMDYFNIETVFLAKKKEVVLWNNEASYKQSLALAQQYFKQRKKVELRRDFSGVKKMLSDVFLGEGCDWYEYQHQYLDAILPAEEDLIVSLPTGAGKSLLFQAPALYRSSISHNLSIVITPLKALMKDQVEGLWERGFISNVDFISGDKSFEETKNLYRRIAGGEVTMVFVTPERFRSKSFEKVMLLRIQNDEGLEYVVFDEAHCISQWGQEFRPDYFYASSQIASWFDHKNQRFSASKLLFSATISQQVLSEIKGVLPTLKVVPNTNIVYNPIQDHISLGFKTSFKNENRLEEIAYYLKNNQFNHRKSKGLVFVNSRAQAEEASADMPSILQRIYTQCEFAENVAYYHAGMDTEERNSVYEKYKSNEINLLFATKAFGMGMDISDIHFIAHLSPPSAFEDYLQEVGRAGRNKSKRIAAGFIADNPIQSLCLASDEDFRKIADRLHKSALSWAFVKEVKKEVEQYTAKFLKVNPPMETPVVIPFNLLTRGLNSINDENETNTKFRLSLHWLEKLGRIKLGYFAIAQLEFEKKSLEHLGREMPGCSDPEIKPALNALWEVFSSLDKNRLDEKVSVPISMLRSKSGMALSKLFRSLIKGERIGLIKMTQTISLKHTKQRTEEVKYLVNEKNATPWALKLIFNLVESVLEEVGPKTSRVFDNEYLDIVFKKIDSIHNSKFNFFINSSNESKIEKSRENYLSDFQKKRIKHVFRIIRLFRKIKHESIFNQSDFSKNHEVNQSIFNGCSRNSEWRDYFRKLERDCIGILKYIGEENIKFNNREFRWQVLLEKTSNPTNFQGLSDAIFILTLMGYVRSSGLMPHGIEVYLKSIDAIDETISNSGDEAIKKEFDEVQQIRTLKQIALKAISDTDSSKHDEFIKGYFSCKSIADFINHLQQYIPSTDPIFQAFRGDAIKEQEDRLNPEQKLVYNSPITKNINVAAGPGSGKTHTLSLRVARLVHHERISPENILVLAYNRAVVSELKHRLKTLFQKLGYAFLSKRIKIRTFHELALVTCSEKIKNNGDVLKFEKWEEVLHNELKNNPGLIMNSLGGVKHILIDEFQDINDIRIEILDLIIQQLPNVKLFVIGDPNQSIYGYDRSVMDPYHYYDVFNEQFSPLKFSLMKNYRSYSGILLEASKLLVNDKAYQKLQQANFSQESSLRMLLTEPIQKQAEIPPALNDLLEQHSDSEAMEEFLENADYKLYSEAQNTVPESFMDNYVEVHKATINNSWEDKLLQLLKEQKVVVDEDGKVSKKPYQQIAIMFRTNNELYRGFQKIQQQNISNVRVRIQGSSSGEFLKIRECFHYLEDLLKKDKNSQQTLIQTKVDLEQYISKGIPQALSNEKNWDSFYLGLFYALLQDYLDNLEGKFSVDKLITHIQEMTRRDDGQLYQIFEKYNASSKTQTEIVLTTMHKVKGLEYDAVIVTPSFSDLPLNSNSPIPLRDQIEEERRLLYVAYTRAKYRLAVFQHQRETAIINYRELNWPSLTSLGVPVKPDLDKIQLSWPANSYNFSKGVNDYIKKYIKVGDQVSIHFRQHGNYLFRELIHNDTAVAALSKNAIRTTNNNTLLGYIVSEVIVYTLEDSKVYDAKNGTNYTQKWCPAAIKQGYIYLVNFAGYGQ